MRCLYFQQTSTHNVNEDLMELFLMCCAAKLSFASSVHVIIPHFPYARCDCVAPREPISPSYGESAREIHADHAGITIGSSFRTFQGFSIPVDVPDARTIFADYFKRRS